MDSTGHAQCADLCFAFQPTLLHAPAGTQGGGSAEDEGAGNWTADVLAIALHPSATHCPEVGRSRLEMHTDT